MSNVPQTLLAACKNGDRLAQRQFYDLFKDKMFAVCLRYANSREDARDMLQEGFIKVFRDLHQFRGEGSFEGWVRRVIVHSALQYLMKQKKALQFSDLEDVSYQVADDVQMPMSEPQDNAQVLIKLMHKLPTGFRTVLNLYVLEDYSHQQIADTLGISVGTSKSQLNRAKAYLRALYEKTLTS